MPIENQPNQFRAIKTKNPKHKKDISDRAKHLVKSKKFEVKIYYSGFCTYQIEATNDAEAIIAARNQQIDSIKLLSNLENWKEADTAELNGSQNIRDVLNYST